MKCKKCGAQIKEGNIYCSQCGLETQIVPEYNLIDDYLALNVSSLENENNNNENQIFDENTHNDSTIKIKKEKKKKKVTASLKDNQNNKKRKHYMILALVFSIMLIIGTIILFITINYRNNNSYDYQIENAKKSIKNLKHETAINYLDRALKLDSTSIEARLLLADEYTTTEDFDSAIIILKEIIKLDNNNYDAYESLIKLYIQQKDYSSAAKLLSAVKDEEILTSYNDYSVQAPRFSHDDGKYNKNITVEMTTNNKSSIYYTLDGTNPIENGILYTEPVKISAGENEIRAFSVNKYGISSKEISRNITIEYSAPDMPIITPASGTYSDNVEINITCDSDCIIYYTWDGNVPDTSSSVYEGDLCMISGNNVLSIVAISKEGKSSRVARMNYICNPSEHTE